MIYQIEEKKPSIAENCYVAPTADIIGDVTVEEGASVWFGTVLRGDVASIRIGKRSNVQDGSVAHSDHGFPTEIGENVTIGHKVIIHGCKIGDGSLVGMGAIILNGVTIGKECLIAAGALLPEGMVVPDRSLVIGMPAKVVGPVSKEHLQRLIYSSDHYKNIIPVYSSLKEIKEDH